MTEEHTSQQGSEPTEPESTAVAPDADGQYDLKRQFREALARKRGTQADAGAHSPDAASKVRGAHGPASSQKSFRRKSGG